VPVHTPASGNVFRPVRRDLPHSEAVTPGTASYTVRIDAIWNGKPGSWTWSFSTVSLRGIDASDDRSVASSINVASLVHGTVGYGGMRNSETVFLQLAAGEQRITERLFVHGHSLAGGSGL
jgi:hypothetical protein